MKLAFVPTPLFLLLLAGAVPVAVLAAVVPGLGVAVLIAVLALVVAFFVEGLRGLGGAEAWASVSRAVPKGLSVGEDGTIVLALRSHMDRPLLARLADGCPPSLRPKQEVLEVRVPAHQERELSYTIQPLARGAFPFGPLELRGRRPGGLAEHRQRLDLGGEARVHPNLRNLVRYELRARRDLLHQGGARRTRILGRDGDFERLRDFVPGDDIRHIDWKATARQRRPITRVYQAEKAQNLLILVDATRLMAARAAGLTKLDFAVNAALMLAFVGLTRGDRVGVGVFDEGIRAWLPPQAGHTQFGRVLDLLFDQQPSLSFPRYREAARQVVRQNRRRSLVVWLTDLLDGEQGRELLLALRALRRRHLSLVVAMDDPDVQALATGSPSSEPELYARVAASELLDERETLIRKLRGEGANVVDRPPEEITAALVDRYLEIKQQGAL